jgi:lysozyme family protein
MQSDYKAFVDRMIGRYEGGYGWDRADPGGPTKYGITCYDLAAHRGEKMTSMATWAPTVQAMPLAEAEDIYGSKYATLCRFDELGPGKDCALFDELVNSGARIVPVCRRLLNVPGGARLDDGLLAAINAAPASFIDDFCAERLAFMHAIRGGAAWQQFGHGWGARVADLERYCNALAAGHPQEPPSTAPDLSAVPTPKAIDEEAWEDILAGFLDAAQDAGET